MSTAEDQLFHFTSGTNKWHVSASAQHDVVSASTLSYSGCTPAGASQFGGSANKTSKT